jgi:probable blue pigment (indigoidine) exporter
MARAVAPPADASLSPPLLGLLAALVVLWGLNWPVMKLALMEVPPWTFRVICLSIGGLGLLAVTRLTGESIAVPPGRWRPMLYVALINVTVWHLASAYALLYIDSGRAAIIAYTMPVWATVLAWPVLGERPTWRRLAGLALGLSGVALLVGGPLASSAPAAAAWAKWPGVAALLATALMFASGTVFAKRAPVAMAPVPLVAWQLAIGLLPVAAVAAAFEPAPDLARVTWVGWGCLAYVAVLAQGVAYLAWFRALRRLRAGTAAIGSLLIPVIGVFGSALALGEPLGVRQVAALGLTLGGVALAARG